MITGYQAFVETKVPDNQLIVSRTDLTGVITYANETFAEISGYSVDELVGQHHNIVRHPDMPRSAFKDLWATIRRGEMWKGYVKNLRKDGGYYWVFAEVSGVYKDGELIEYKSMRVPIDEETTVEIQNKYDKMRESEENNCRMVAYVSCDSMRKLLKYAKDEGKDPSAVLESILDDALL